ncbi:MAG: lysophospholipase [Leptospirales bacterium]|nr:lysophospholipase [Leptospirales bacterium]
MKGDYRIETGSFSGWNGTNLRWKAWLCTEPQRGRNLVFHHGFGEHCGRYEYLVEALAGDGVNLFGFDARGHGRSDGERGMGTVTEMVRDLELFIGFVREEFGVRLPLLLGHSMGGLIVLCFGLSYSNQWDLSGILTSGAALSVRMNPVMRMKQISGNVLVHFAPDLVLPAGIDTRLLSHDERTVEAYNTDPLVHGSLSIRFGLDFVAKGKWAIANAHKLRIPMFMGHGADDGIANPDGTRQFFKGLTGDIAELHIYPGLYHEIFNETPAARQAVLDDYRRFIQRRFEDLEPELAGNHPEKEKPV